MSDYPSQSPWGPHGPQVNVPSTTPNPTPSDPAPNFGAPEPSYPGYSPPSGGGGGGDSSGGGGGGSAGGAGGGTVRLAARAISEAPIGGWMRNLAIAGAVLGLFVGAGRGFLLHLPMPGTGVLALRLGLAGAAAGAGFPPCIRAAFLAARAAIWIGLALALWVAALALAGQLPWLARFW